MSNRRKRPWTPEEFADRIRSSGGFAHLETFDRIVDWSEKADLALEGGRGLRYATLNFCETSGEERRLFYLFEQPDPVFHLDRHQFEPRYPALLKAIDDVLPGQVTAAPHYPSVSFRALQDEEKLDAFLEVLSAALEREGRSTAGS